MANNRHFVFVDSKAGLAQGVFFWTPLSWELGPCSIAGLKPSTSVQMLQGGPLECTYISGLSSLSTLFFSHPHAQLSIPMFHPSFPLHENLPMDFITNL